MRASRSAAIATACVARNSALNARRRPSRRLRSALRQRDRKSTRLNSSHGYISYAVFCLKKKKKTKTFRFIGFHSLDTREAIVFTTNFRTDFLTAPASRFESCSHDTLKLVCLSSERYALR